MISSIILSEKALLTSSFIIESNNLSEIKVSSLIREFCLLEKALGGEYNGKFILKKNSQVRYTPISSYDHYRVIILHGLRELGIVQDEEYELNKSQLEDLARIIWH